MEHVVYIYDFLKDFFFSKGQLSQGFKSRVEGVPCPQAHVMCTYCGVEEDFFQFLYCQVSFYGEER